MYVRQINARGDIYGREYGGNVVTVEVNLPRISVVMPSYNQAAYLREAIESVLSQDYPNIELIVVDGGSTDGSGEIIRSYAERIAWWCSEPDAGQSDALNKGFSHTTGEILAWLNSDDLLETGAFRCAAERLIPGRSEWLIGVTRLVDGQGGRIADRVGPPVSVDTFIEWGRHYFSQQAVFWTRAMWEAAGPVRNDLHYVMDLDLWWHMFNVAEPRRTEQLLACYRLHEDAKCVAGPDRLNEEYRQWLGSVLCGEVRSMDDEKCRQLADRLLQRFEQARVGERSLKRLHGHAVIGRFLWLWRRFVNPRLPEPPDVS